MVFKRLGVLADDLTGAGDVALGFFKARRTLEIAIADGRSPLRPPSPKTRVWILDTESRFLPPGQAARRVRRAVRALKAWGAEFFYKKIDSALRGPVAAEFLAFLECLQVPQGRKVAFMPAFPRVGRTTSRGFQFIHGKPLDRSIFARDPRSPVRSAFLPELLGPGLYPRLWVPDAVAQGDVRRAARRLLADPGIFPRAAGGSAGLVEELGPLLCSPAPAPKPKAKPSPAREMFPVTVVVGSANPRSRRQMRFLKKVLSKSLLTRLPDSAKNSLKRNILLVHTPAQRRDPRPTLKELVRKVREFSRRFGSRRYVVTGGETAYGLCRMWKQFRWRLVDRVDTGVPVCVPRDGGPGPRYLVLKPGGFGGDDVLVKGVKKLQRLEEN